MLSTSKNNNIKEKNWAECGAHDCNSSICKEDEELKVTLRHGDLDAILHKMKTRAERAINMAQQVKHLLPKPGNLSSNPRAQIRRKERADSTK